jgi:hypothetical protein
LTTSVAAPWRYSTGGQSTAGAAIPAGPAGGASGSELPDDPVKNDFTRPVKVLSAEGAGAGDAGTAAPGPPPVMPPHEQLASAIAPASVKAVRQQRRRDALREFT